MKVTIDKRDEKKIKYPCLMMHRNTGSVILATEIRNNKWTDEYTGVLIISNSIENTVGDYSEGWSSYFMPFTGTITLEND